MYYLPSFCFILKVLRDQQAWDKVCPIPVADAGNKHLSHLAWQCQAATSPGTCVDKMLGGKTESPVT